MRPIPKSELIQINVPASPSTAMQYYFPDTNDVIRTNKGGQTVLTMGIEFFPSQAVANAEDNTPNMSSVDMRKGFLHLYVNNGEFVKIPLSKLISVHNNDITVAGVGNYPYSTFFPDFDDIIINYGKSFVIFPSVPATLGVCMLCCVYYEYLEERRNKKVLLNL